MGLNLWKFKFCVGGVHLSNLFHIWGTQDFYYLDQLIDGTLSWEQRIAYHHFGYYASDRPYINLVSIVNSAKDQLRRSIVSTAYVRYIWLSLN